MTTADSATLDAVTPASARPRESYWRLWARLPRELVFLLLAFPVALTGFIVSITLVTTGFGTLVTFVGIFLLVGVFYVSRGFGLFELIRLEWAGQPAITRPEWQDARAKGGFWGWLRALFGNGHYWLYLLHTLVVAFPVALFSWIVTVVWLSVAAGGVSYWFWEYFIPSGDRDGWHFSSWLFSRDGFSSVGSEVLDSLFIFVVGLAFVTTLPLVTRGLTSLHQLIARPMLGAFRSDALEREVIDLGASRQAAASAEGSALRRLERDIHDGPQQRLVRLQMDLAAADRQLDADPDKARLLISEAIGQSKEALEELRALSRGFAPPLLLDRGLVAALDSLVARSTVPVTFVNGLTDTVLPQETERSAYFIASELLTNVAKHSGSAMATLTLVADGSSLRLSCSDDGSGGAAAVPGHGLEGLDERVRGLGGTMTISSPAGGPTEVIALLPL